MKGEKNEDYTTNLIVSLLLTVTCPFLMFAADASSGYKVTYDGGSLPSTKVGTDMKLVITGDHLQFLKDKSEITSMPAATVSRNQLWTGCQPACGGCNWACRGEFRYR
jgi:hypothetical protein